MHIDDRVLATSDQYVVYTHARARTHTHTQELLHNELDTKHRTFLDWLIIALIVSPCDQPWIASLSLSSFPLLLSPALSLVRGCVCGRLFA